MRFASFVLLAALLEAAGGAASPGRATCTATDGSPVRYTATPLSLHDLGGGYVPMIGWPARGAPMVGSLRFEWALRIKFEDPRLTHFDRPAPGLHSTASECWVAYHVGTDRGNDGNVTTKLIDASYSANPWAPHSQPERERPTSTPRIRGYRFVQADKAFGPPFQWIGIWNAEKGSSSLLLAFDDRHTKRLARLPMRLAGISTLPSPDAPPVGITLVGDGRAKSPVALLELTWVPTSAADRP